MSEDSKDTLQCHCCEQWFSGRVFEISLQWQSLDFGNDARGVEVNDSLSLGYYCSRFCLGMRKEEVIGRTGIPIRPAGIGPIERCAKCGGPVDMTRFHRAIVVEEYTLDDGGAHVARTSILAVVCNRCSAYGPFGLY